MHIPKLGATLAVAAVIFLILPGLVLGDVGLGSQGLLGPLPPADIRNETLILEAGNNTSANLWGTTITPRANLLPNEADLVNATPDRTVLWPGGTAGDKFNPFNDTTVDFSKKGGLNWTPTPTSITQFAAWCKSIACTPILELPGEVDNSSLAADIVACATTPTSANCTDPYTHGNISGWGLDPAYWEIGNEPGLWTQWDRSWTEWCHICNASMIDASQYAAEVEQYIQNITLVDPGIQVIGLPGLGTGLSGNFTTWMDDVISDVIANGSHPNLAGVAIHVYPGGDVNATIKPTLSQFYGALAQGNGTSSYDRTLGAIHGIPGCQTPRLGGCETRLFVTEIGTALSHDGYAPYSIDFPGALGEADEGIQELEFPGSQLVNVDLYGTVFDTNNAWFNLSGGTRPSYLVASEILSHLGTDAFPIFNQANDSNLEAIATIDRSDQDRHDLLLVNTNLNQTVEVNSSFITSTSASIKGAAQAAAFSPTEPVQSWSWVGINATISVAHSASIQGGLYNTSYPSTPGPVPGAYTTGLPTTISVPPQSMVLFESYNAPAYPVTFVEHGLNVNASGPTSHWFLDVNGTRTATTDQTNLTLLLPTGSYPTSGPLVLAPQPGSELIPDERFVPELPSHTVVGTSSVTVTFDYTLQWSVNISWNSNEGLVTATNPVDNSPIAVPSWWNDSAPLLLQVVPNPGYAFYTWFGRGAGNHSKVNGNGSFGNYSLEHLLIPTGPVDEVAEFATGYAVNFIETGLPTGTPWNVSVRGLNESTANSSYTFYEVNGSWAYQVPEVSIRNAITGNLTDFRVNRTLPAIVVNGAPVPVPIRFEELFPVTFAETGLPIGKNWSWNVYVANASSASSLNVSGTAAHTAGTTTGSSIVVAEINSTKPEGWGYNVPYVYPSGTYGYRPERTEWNGTVAPGPDGNFTLDGAPVTVQITFVALTPNATRYPVYFSESNLTPGTNWSVTVANSSDVASTGWSTSSTILLWEPNSTKGGVVGAWGFSARAQGYRFNSTHAFVIVDGASTSATVNFEFLYSITFEENGLPLPYDPPVGWNVSVATQNTTLFGVNGTSTGRTLVLYEPNGTWGFLASAGPEYHFNRTLANIPIEGSDVTVTVHFELLVKTDFEETGLPSGTPWPVDVHGFDGPDWNNGSTSVKYLFQTSGDWGYTIGDTLGQVVVAGANGTTTYRVVRTLWNGTQAAGPSGNFTVGTVGGTVQLSFVALTPAGPYYPVTFYEIGLPSGSSWTVDVRNDTESSGANSPILFAEHAGAYAFAAGAAGGFNVTESLHFDLTGASLSTTVFFVPGNNVTWKETGLGPNLTWSVVINGSRNLPARGGWANVREFNGTGYGFDIPVVQDVPGGPAYVPIPRLGTLDLTGGTRVVEVRFILVTYSVTLAVTGLPIGDQYQIRLSNVTVTTRDLSVNLDRPNGTWTYDIVPPAGYYGAPQGGNVTVTGHNIVVTIAVLPIGRGPTPPIWTLVTPAASAAAVLGFSGLGMFALLGAIRRRRMGASL